MSKGDAPDGRSSTSPLIPEPVVAPVTFIVRLSAGAAGRISGVVEHPGTGRKERFDGLDSLAPVLAALSQSVRGHQTSTGDRSGRDPPKPPEDECS